MRDYTKNARKDPGEAASRLAAILLRRGQGATLKQIAEEWNLSVERVRQIIIRHEKKSKWQSKLSPSARAIVNGLVGSFLGLYQKWDYLSVRTEPEVIDILLRAGFGDKSEWERQPGCGAECLQEIEEWLLENGTIL